MKLSVGSYYKWVAGTFCLRTSSAVGNLTGKYISQECIYLRWPETAVMSPEWSWGRGRKRMIHSLIHSFFHSTSIYKHLQCPRPSMLSVLEMPTVPLSSRSLYSRAGRQTTKKQMRKCIRRVCRQVLGRKPEQHRQDRKCRWCYMNRTVLQSLCTGDICAGAWRKGGTATMWISGSLPSKQRRE